MKLGNFEFPEVTFSDGTKTLLQYTSPDLKFVIVPVVSTLKSGVTPFVAYLQLYGIENDSLTPIKSQIAIPPNLQQDLDNWNKLTGQGLTFENLHGEPIAPVAPTVIDFGREVFKKLDVIGQKLGI
jgi:hypothetical protein